jgi:hypothetical protein
VRRPEEAAAEVHMLLCRRDLALGVLALKSLLRFPEVRVAATLSEDGSLRAADRAWVDRHVPGCRWLPRRTDDPHLKAALAPRPRLAALYASTYHPSCKLLHPAPLARCSRVIVMDPDTAFSKRPDTLIAWAEKGEVAAWFLHDHQDEVSNVPSETREAFAEIARRLTPPDRAWSMPYYFFNSGLLLYRPEQCDFDLAERYLEWREVAPQHYKIGKPGLWFGDWTPEQTCYQVMFALMDTPTRPLGEDYRLGGPSGYTFNHFLQLTLVQERSLQLLRGLIADILGQVRKGKR